MARCIVNCTFEPGTRVVLEYENGWMSRKELERKNRHATCSTVPLRNARADSSAHRCRIQS